MREAVSAMRPKRKVGSTDFAGVYLDLPSNYDEETDAADEEEKGHAKHRDVSNYVMSYWLSLQASPFIIVLIIMCLFMSAFMAMHTSQFSRDFHIISDSFLDSHRPMGIAQLLRRTTLKPSGQESIRLVNPPWTGCLAEIPQDLERQHIVPPPPGPATLVCCNTTKGVLNIEVHPSWAPLGAERFLYMVKDGFFSTQVPLFRAMKDFLVQFGLAGDPQVQTRYHRMGNLVDDPPWLPLGPPGREINGIKRYQKGYLGYAGAGKNSRGTQLILAFQPNIYLGGGSPWEVPFGQLIGNESFATTAKFYTGYGEKPSQGKIMNRGIAYIKEEFPKIDIITGCAVIREDVPWNYP